MKLLAFKKKNIEFDRHCDRGLLSVFLGRRDDQVDKDTS